jgi:hypothetical protein
MIPAWLFFVLIGIIGWLLYLTRTTNKTFIIICRDKIKRFSFRSKKSGAGPATIPTDSTPA